MPSFLVTLGLHNICHHVVDLSAETKSTQESRVFIQRNSLKIGLCGGNVSGFWLGTYETLRALRSIVVISYKFSLLCTLAKLRLCKAKRGCDSLLGRTCQLGSNSSPGKFQAAIEICAPYNFTS